MTWFVAVLVVLVIGGVAVVAAGRGSALGPAYDDRVVSPPRAPATEGAGPAATTAGAA